jgi:hypothetical protein
MEEGMSMWHYIEIVLYNDFRIAVSCSKGWGVNHRNGLFMSGHYWGLQERATRVSGRSLKRDSH